MYEVKLPLLKWFSYMEEEKKNIYSGSLRPDPTKGCLCQTTFNYQVKMAKEDGKEYLEVIYYYIPAWNMEFERRETSPVRFEATEFGKEKAEKWLTNEFLAGKDKKQQNNGVRKNDICESKSRYESK